LTVAPKIVLETVPAHLIGFGFGSFANIFINFFITITVALELFPNAGSILNILPIPFLIVAIIGLKKFYPGDSATQIIENNKCINCKTLKHRCSDCKKRIKAALHR